MNAPMPGWAWVCAGGPSMRTSPVLVNATEASAYRLSRVQCSAGWVLSRYSHCTVTGGTGAGWAAAWSERTAPPLAAGTTTCSRIWAGKAGQVIDGLAGPKPR